MAMVGVWGGEFSEEGSRLDAKYRKALSRTTGDLHFKGEFGETLQIPLGAKEEGLGFALLFGLGKKRGVSVDTIRKTGARLVQEIARLGFKEVVTETSSRINSAKWWPVMPWPRVLFWVGIPGINTRPPKLLASAVKSCACG